MITMIICNEGRQSSPAAGPAHTQSTRREGEGGGRNQGVSELPHTGFVLPPTPLCLYHIKELCFVLASYSSCASSGYNACFKCSTKTGGVNQSIVASKYSATSTLQTTGKEPNLQRKPPLLVTRANGKATKI